MLLAATTHVTMTSGAPARAPPASASPVTSPPPGSRISTLPQRSGRYFLVVTRLPDPDVPRRYERISTLPQIRSNCVTPNFVFVCFHHRDCSLSVH